MRSYDFPPQNPELPADSKGGGFFKGFFSKIAKGGKPSSTEQSASINSAQTEASEKAQKFSELIGQLNAMGISETNLQSRELSTNNGELFNLIKRYLELRHELLVADISIGKDFSIAQALTQLNKIIPDNNKKSSGDNLAEFFEKVESGNTALAITIERDINPTNSEMNDFANSVRASEQSKKLRVVVYSEDQRDLDKGNLGEMVINGRYLQVKK